MTTKERKTLRRLDETPSKQEEIDWLEKCAEMIPAASYLADLFTGNFIGWVKHQILADFPPDIYEHMVYGKEQRLESYDSLQKENKDQAKQIAALERDHKKETEGLRREILKHQNRIDEYHRKYDHLNDSYNTIVDRWHEGENKIGDLNQEIQRQKAEIDKLKIHLYDLMMPPRPPS